MLNPRSLVAALLVLPGAGCVNVEQDFVCSADAQCVRAGEQGTCEPTRHCAFPDESCVLSGRRYARHSGSGSDECVVTGSIYVTATNGNDANPGTDAAPFLTIAHGASVLEPGDTLIVKEGTYAEALTNELRAGESWRRPITVAAYPGHTVVLTAPSADSRPLSIEDPAQRYIVILGLSIDAGPSSTQPIKIGADHVRIKGCEVKNSIYEGISVYGADGVAGYNELIDLHVHDNGREWPNAMENGVPGGIYIGAADNLVERCHIHHNIGVGIELYTSTEGWSASRNVIRNNVIHDEHTKDATGLFITSGTGTIAYNNVIYSLGDQGIRLDYGAREVKLFNNTVYSTPTLGLGIAGSNDAVIDNNLFFECASGAMVDEGMGTVKGEGNWVEGDPGFVDAAAGDFHLREDSPAIDKGATLPEVPDDYDGVPRPQGAGYDPGAFESP